MSLLGAQWIPRRRQREPGTPRPGDQRRRVRRLDAGANGCAAPEHPALILVVRDSANASQGLYDAFIRSGYQAVLALDAYEALDLAQSESPDLIVMDLDTPGMDGLELVRRLREHPKTKNSLILVATERREERDQLFAFSFGADAFVVKPCRQSAFLARVQAILRRRRRREGNGSPVIYKGITLDGYKCLVMVDGRRVSVTRAEFRLLETFLRRPGRAFTRAELISVTNGDDSELKMLGRAIDVRICSLRKKLREGGELIETVHGVGYRLRE